MKQIGLGNVHENINIEIYPACVCVCVCVCKQINESHYALILIKKSP